MKDDSPSVVALKRAIASIGSQSALAKVIGLSQQSVSKMVQRQRPLPAEHVLTVEAATGVSRHDLRPDIYPREGSPAHPGEGAPGGPTACPEHGRRAGGDSPSAIEGVRP